ncbi:MAG: STAS domain-containing protein [Solirubrobacterales bacterium]
MPPLELVETEPRPDCRVIQVEGELDLNVAFQLAGRLEDAAGVAIVLVDLKGCAFVDSTGLAAFVHAREAMEKSNTRFAIVGANDRVYRVLEMTGMSGHGLLFEDVDAALRELDASSAKPD